jgi:hypothetical protein
LPVYPAPRYLAVLFFSCSLAVFSALLATTLSGLPQGDAGGPPAVSRLLQTLSGVALAAPE